MRTLAVVTVDRSDYGILRPVLERIRKEPGLALRLIAAGTHLSEAHGLTVKEIEADGFPVLDRVATVSASDGAEGTAAAMGRGLQGFAEIFGRARPDILVVLGDRFEMFSAAAAALPFRIPVAHIHGGEVTEGAIDEAFRHSISKMSHLHFTSTESHARRLKRMGEEPWRVTVSGAPGLDNVASTPTLSLAELEARLGWKFPAPPILVTFHPATLESAPPERQLEELLAALDGAGRPLVFTRPNADAGGRAIARRLEAYVGSRENAWLAGTLGTQLYFSLMAAAGAMAGNSSSGLIEAPSFGLPVVNVGARQRGRLRGANVIDVKADRRKIAAGLRKALSPSFRKSLRGRSNPYGRGDASARIVRRLKTVPLDERLIMKKFYDGAVR